MPLQLAAWNMQESLAEPNTMMPAVEAIRGLDSDVVVLSDAYSLTNPLHGSLEETLGAAREILGDEGYDLFEVEYDDSDPWHHDRNLMVLSRVAVEFGGIRLATRNAAEAETADGLRIVGAHFDDRGEAARVSQAQAFLERHDAEEPVILAGDLNSLDVADSWSSVLGSDLFGAVGPLMPTRRLRSIAGRLNESARGDAMRLLAGRGFRDADTLRIPTFPARRPFLRPDHILASWAVRVEGFEVGEAGSPYTDHRPLKATLNW